MVQDYKTLHGRGEDEIEIEKSVFIGHSAPVASEDEARAFIEAVRQMHKEATHNVWAYTIGMNMEIQRYSDDGEPKGTAGIPVLEVMKKEELRNVAVVVTRYYGGVKLGAGGLVRAYTKGAKIALDSGRIVTKQLYKELFISVEYHQLGKLQNEFSNRGFIIKDIEYAENVRLTIYAPSEQLADIKKLATDITSAAAQLEEGENFYLSYDVSGNVILD
ncbi:IMPACT family member YvyE [Peptoclostridium acidaminophilum DSM 3953]|uniref:IMPACT family member YvyE n=1 Tax=Peptoclostridium acidaminophilum DSM 3953 TaxID=1286171 RepID=W8T5X1_PEPAC|nr:YigZ family protein [Peptoclostridium acidaminophilum]AHM56255.1 IMPACT family member YvyE [Peptoclostridium acidaminophilum DSM 3953]